MILNLQICSDHYGCPPNFAAILVTLPDNFGTASALELRYGLIVQPYLPIPIPETVRVGFRPFGTDL